MYFFLKKEKRCVSKYQPDLVFVALQMSGSSCGFVQTNEMEIGSSLILCQLKKETQVKQTKETTDKNNNGIKTKNKIIKNL